MYPNKNMAIVYRTTKKLLQILSQKTWCTKKPFGCLAVHHLDNFQGQYKCVYIFVCILM